MFLDFLFKEKSPIMLDVEMYLYNAMVIEKYKQTNFSDNDYIYFALLVYARILSVLSLMKVPRVTAENTCESYIRSYYDIESGELKAQKLYDLYKMTIPFNKIRDACHMQMKSNSIYVKKFPTKSAFETSNYIHLAFLYAWDNIELENLPKLREAFMKLSKHYLIKKRMSFREEMFLTKSIAYN